MRKTLLMLSVLVMGWATMGASCGGARHIATVTVVSAHGVLATIQDTENAIVCGRPTAPAPPQCVPLETHRQIAQMLGRAFTLDAAIAKTLRDMPAGAPQPDQVLKELGEIGDLVKAIVELIPQSATKTSLVQNLGGK
jgi:hypothetical protein